MATVRNDLVGTVLAVNSINQYVSLAAGATIPGGYFVGGHAVQGGDAGDQTPPWAVTGISAADILDATEVGIAVLTAEDEEAARTAIGAAEDV